MIFHRLEQLSSKGERTLRPHRVAKTSEYNYIRVNKYPTLGIYQGIFPFESTGIYIRVDSL